LIEDPDYYEIYSASFPLNIDYERCLRISQLDSLNNKTKVYLSFHSQLFEQRRVLRQMLESILQGHSLDIINYTSEFL
jgi:fructosamine-3-kinase